jgi:hypothetical protein
LAASSSRTSVSSSGLLGRDEPKTFRCETSSGVSWALTPDTSLHHAARPAGSPIPSNAPLWKKRIAFPGARCGRALQNRDGVAVAFRDPSVTRGNVNGPVGHGMAKTEDQEAGACAIGSRSDGQQSGRPDEPGGRLGSTKKRSH